jgi:hypothetical protein
MIVSHADRFVFIHNPKCAGTSFRNALQRYYDKSEALWFRSPNTYFGCEIDLGHLRLWELFALYPAIFESIPRYNSLVLVRNPYERFISALAQYLTWFWPQIDLRSMPEGLRRRYAEQFIYKELRMARVLGEAIFVHFPHNPGMSCWANVESYRTFFRCQPTRGGGRKSLQRSAYRLRRSAVKISSGRR